MWDFTSLHSRLALSVWFLVEAAQSVLQLTPTVAKLVTWRSSHLRSGFSKFGLYLKHLCTCLSVLLARFVQQCQHLSFWPHGDLQPGVHDHHVSARLLCGRQFWGSQEQNEVSCKFSPHDVWDAPWTLTLYVPDFGSEPMWELQLRM